jgi:hypothetical protein
MSLGPSLKILSLGPSLNVLENSYLFIDLPIIEPHSYSKRPPFNIRLRKIQFKVNNFTKISINTYE